MSNDPAVRYVDWDNWLNSSGAKSVPVCWRP